MVSLDEPVKDNSNLRQFYAMAEIRDAVVAELATALDEFPPMASYHEGYAIILEEVDELKKEVWKSKTDAWYKSRGYSTVPKEPKERMRAEALQIAAMAMRFALELT